MEVPYGVEMDVVTELKPKRGHFETKKGSFRKSFNKLLIISRVLVLPAFEGFNTNGDCMRCARMQSPVSPGARRIRPTFHFGGCPAPNFAENVGVDQRLVTGQNPASATAAAGAIVRLLKD